MADTNEPSNSASASVSDPSAQTPTPTAPPASNGTQQPASTIEASHGKEISGAEKKRLAKAEKAARRAKDKAPGPEIPTTSNAAAQPNGQSSGPKPIAQAASASSKPGQRRKSVSATSRQDQQLPVRRRLSQTAQKEPKRENKQVDFFSQLYSQRKQNLDGISKDVHPQIQALGMQSASYCLCGSHARCAAMLLALKCVIQSYATPPGTSLPRHLSSQYLSPQLNYLKSCRPFSVSQSNAIRWLKNVIANVDPSAPELNAKNDICSAIDTFIRERLTVADQVIAETAAQEIRDGDTILTFAKSAVVTQALQTAKNAGTNFDVVVVDSRPLFEGKNLAKSLVRHGIEVSYCSLSGLAHAAKGASKCLLGAHAVLGNGSLYSRAGSAMVATMAKTFGAPVIVCVESIKFAERVALNSIVMNELAPEDELLLPDVDAQSKDGLSSWREQDNLLLLNPLYDITPPDCVSMYITELGSVPSTAAPVVQRMSASAQESI